MKYNVFLETHLHVQRCKSKLLALIVNLKFAKPYINSGFNYSFHRSPVCTLWAPDSRTTQGCPWTSTCSSKVARPRLLYLASTRRTDQPRILPLRDATAPWKRAPLSQHSHAWKRYTAWASPYSWQEASPRARTQHRCSRRENQRLLTWSVNMETKGYEWILAGSWAVKESSY